MNSAEIFVAGNVRVLLSSCRGSDHGFTMRRVKEVAVEGL